MVSTQENVGIYTVTGAFAPNLKLKCKEQPHLLFYFLDSYLYFVHDFGQTKNEGI